MKKEKNAVESVLELQSSMNELTVDKVLADAPKVEETELKIDYKDIAKREGIRYIEPYKKHPPIGTLPAKWKIMHARDWEYVKGVFENYESAGESFKFTFCKWPGDPDCHWEVPAGIPVYVPRMIAKLLSGEKDEQTGIKAMEYHQFGHQPLPSSSLRPMSEMEQLAVLSTSCRGKFRALGAF